MHISIKVMYVGLFITLANSLSAAASATIEGYKKEANTAAGQALDQLNASNHLSQEEKLRRTAMIQRTNARLSSGVSTILSYAEQLDDAAEEDGDTTAMLTARVAAILDTRVSKVDNEVSNQDPFLMLAHFPLSRFVGKRFILGGIVGGMGGYVLYHYGSKKSAFDCFGKIFVTSAGLALCGGVLDYKESRRASHLLVADSQSHIPLILL